MSRSHRVREADVRKMLRLMAELAELPPDPATRSRHLLKGLCKLLAADVGTDIITRRVIHGPKKSEVCNGSVVVGLTGGELDHIQRYFQQMDLGDPISQWVYAHAEAGEVHTRARRQIVDDAHWRTSSHYHELRKPCHILEPLIHCRPTGDGRHVRTICLHREDGNKPFTQRDAALMGLFMDQAVGLLTPAQLAGDEEPPIHNAVVLEAVERLSPRQREVFEGLMTGQPIKRIASELGLSRHTVGDYVKEIYSRLEVRSRGELMAKFVPPISPPSLPESGGSSRVKASAGFGRAAAVGVRRLIAAHLGLAPLLWQFFSDLPDWIEMGI